jgi:hypothetical protein
MKLPRIPILCGKAAAEIVPVFGGEETVRADRTRNKTSIGFAAQTRFQEAGKHRKEFFSNPRP